MIFKLQGLHLHKLLGALKLLDIVGYARWRSKESGNQEALFYKISKKWPEEIYKERDLYL